MLTVAVPILLAATALLLAVAAFVVRRRRHRRRDRGDVGLAIVGRGIPPGAVIRRVNSATSAEIGFPWRRRLARWWRCPGCGWHLGRHDLLVLHGDGVTDDTAALQRMADDAAGGTYAAGSGPYWRRPVRRRR